MSTDVVMGEAFDLAVRELDQLIDRRFAARRTVRIEETADGRWIAVTDHAQVFPACEDLDVVIRFVRAFAEKTDNMRVDEDSVEYARMLRIQLRGGYSVRVPALRVVQ